MRTIYSIIILFIISLYVCISPGLAGLSVDGATGINISNFVNSFENSDNKVQMEYRIGAPKIIHYDFILALDSSGSFAETQSQRETILREIPKFLEKIPKYYPGAYINISIISWDDNIDFASDKEKKFNNIYPLKVKLAPINDVFNETKKSFAIDYKCKPSEQTDLSVPVKASLDILKANKPKDDYGTRQFVMLVTGNGEFKPCASDLLKEAQTKDNFYIVGLDILNGSELENHLKSIVSHNTTVKDPISPHGYQDPLFASDPKYKIFKTQANASLSDALLTHYRAFMDKSVATDIEISDQLYCYYTPDLGSLRIKSTKSDSTETGAGKISSQEGDDKITEIKIKVPSLLPNSITYVTFGITNTFNPMTLPVTLSAIDGPLIICSPTKRSNATLDYIWYNGNGRQLPLKIPDSNPKLRIQSSDSSKKANNNDFTILNLLNPLIWLMG